MKKKEKNLLYIVLAVVSFLYLLNLGIGIIEFIPDNMPFFGQIDEAIATLVLIKSLVKLGVKIPYFGNE